MNPERQVAEAAIARSIAQRVPLIVLTGESGTGKSSLCRAVITQVAGAAVSTILNPFLTFRDLLNQVITDFDLPSNTSPDADAPLVATEHELIRSIHAFVAENPKWPALVIVDDAHLLNPLVLGQLRGLLNEGLTVLLSGQPELEERLGCPEFRSVEQRVAQRYRLGSTARQAPGPRRAPVRRLMTAVALLACGWIAGGLWRRVSPPVPTARAAFPSVVPTPALGVPPALAAPPPAAAATPAPIPSPTPQPVETVRPGPNTRTRTADAGSLDALRQRAEGQARVLAGRGDVKALLALRAQSEQRGRQLAASPASLASLLDELDAKIEEARETRLRLDAKAFRR